MIPLVHILHCTSGITFLAHPVRAHVTMHISSSRSYYIYEVCGGAPSGIQGQSPGQTVRGLCPLKLITFLLRDASRSDVYSAVLA